MAVVTNSGDHVRDGGSRQEWQWSPTVGIMLKMEAAGRNGVFGNHVNVALCTTA